MKTNQIGKSTFKKDYLLVVGCVLCWVANKENKRKKSVQLKNRLGVQSLIAKQTLEIREDYILTNMQVIIYGTRLFWFFPIFPVLIVSTLISVQVVIKIAIILGEQLQIIISMHQNLTKYSKYNTNKCKVNHSFAKEHISLSLF